jgi:hypothetical protein
MVGLKAPDSSPKPPEENSLRTIVDETCKIKFYCSSAFGCLKTCFGLDLCAFFNVMESLFIKLGPLVLNFVSLTLGILGTFSRRSQFSRRSRRNYGVVGWRSRLRSL